MASWLGPSNLALSCVHSPVPQLLTPDGIVAVVSTLPSNESEKLQQSIA